MNYQPITIQGILSNIDIYRQIRWENLASHGKPIGFSDLKSIINRGNCQDYPLSPSTDITPEIAELVRDGVRSLLASELWVETHDIDHAMKIVIPEKHPYM